MKIQRHALAQYHISSPMRNYIVSTSCQEYCTNIPQSPGGTHLEMPTSLYVALIMLAKNLKL